MQLTPDEYFDQVIETRQQAMRSMRATIKETWPGIQENMDYKMPTYILDGEALCAVASQKSHMALYIMPHDLLHQFSGKLKKYNMGKSCIRFKNLDDSDLHLFAQILKYTGETYPQSAYYGKRSEK